MSTATSKIAPRSTRTSFACACGGFWKCSPRIVPARAEPASLSCTKSAATPSSRNRSAW
jgi:hypothetical protein